MKHFDLFSGYGGFTLALQRVYDTLHSRSTGKEEQEANTNGNLSNIESEYSREFTTIGFSEIDKYASAVLKYHWPNTKNYGDITSIDARSLPNFDLLTGGFPCQSFSIAGKRGGFEDMRGTLIFDMLRIAKEKTPKYVLGENVKGLANHDGGRTLKTILASFQELGYTVSIEIINAKNYGVPQNRERIFILGMHIPTVCKEITNNGFQVKTDTSVKIIKGFLFQNLLNNLTEVQKLQETASKDLVCGLMVLNAITNGLNGKLEFSNETYKNHWQSFVGLSLKEMREQFTTKPDNLEEKPNIKDGILSTEENIFHSEETELWQSIEKLWQMLWEEVYQAQSKSTTSTAISQTIEKKTFTYAEMLLTIVSFIIQLRNLSSHLWNEVLLDLIVLKGNTFYEPITNQTEERIIGRSCFIRRSNLSSTQQPDNCFVIGFRDGSPREVFFEREGNEINTGENAQRNEVAYCLNAGGDKHRGSYIKQLNNPIHSNNRLYSEEGISPALNTAQGGNRQPKIPTDSRIRRLTPTECERLMGLPDGWTAKGLINDKEVEISDSQRYKLCGNGVVVNVVEEILKNIIL